jgi:hypothetical protein
LQIQSRGTVADELVKALESFRADYVQRNAVPVGSLSRR